ncbi:MAG TPA: hypothetical protein VID74_04505, partial [Gemmatimonadales bacterium]
MFPGRESRLTPGSGNNASVRLRNRHFLVLDLVLLPSAVLLSYLIHFEGLEWGPGQARAAL